ITVRWAPGHIGIAGNERADEEAKKAAQGKDSSNLEEIPPELHGELPWSKSAVRQAFNAGLKADVARDWMETTCYTRTMQYDPKLTKGSYIDAAEKLPR
ncbi:hypothetical protein DFH06DRAFT_903590, partial [Mycena polygramma]